MNSYLRKVTLLSCNCVYNKTLTLLLPSCSCRKLSTVISNEEKKKRRFEIYSQEVKRQKEKIGRIEKIQVNYLGIPKDESFIMNKEISTPYHVAQHINEWIRNRSVLALVNDSKLWDMHRPLVDDCTLRFLHFQDDDPFHVNKAFWRSCSFLLGAVIESAFKDNIQITLHSFPSPNVKSGSFVYDVQMGLDNWKPTQNELRALSAELVKLTRTDVPLHRLDVTSEFAEELFADNSFKLKQIPDIAVSRPDNKVTLYRIGDHIDISRGPMIANTSFLGRTSITAVHQLETEDGLLYRFQGISLPKEIRINHFAYGILEERAKKLNNARSLSQTEGFNPQQHIAQLQ